MPKVYPASMPTSQAFHRQTYRVCVDSRINDEMDVVGHEAVGVDLDAKRLTALPKRVEIILSVVCAKEHIVAAMPALYDVVRVSDEHSA
jgi:hypothetical protein